jgi:hypothetical protein
MAIRIERWNVSCWFGCVVPNSPAGSALITHEPMCIYL